MKLAWLCYYEEGDNSPEFRLTEPEEFMFWKVVPIVFAEVVRGLKF